MLDGVNNSKDQLKKIINLMREKKFVVQFRILNKIEGINFKKSTLEEAQIWIDELSKNNISAVVRPSFGGEVNGACGQMVSNRAKHKEIAINSFQEVFPYLNNIDSSTLMVFDVDSVLIIPKKNELHPFVFQEHKEVVRKYYNSLTKVKKHFLNLNIVAHLPMLVEALSVSFIKEMQQKNIPIIALTAAKKGRYNEKGGDFHNVRYDQLFSLGIDFSKNKYKNDEFTNLSDTFGDYPGIRNGIIYSCGFNNKKGDVLSAFLKSNKEKISKIILFDDKLKHLQSVSQSLKDDFPKIELLAFHYQGVNNLKMSHEVSEKQFENYLKTLLEKVGDLDWIE